MGEYVLDYGRKSYYDCRRYEYEYENIYCALRL